MTLKLLAAALVLTMSTSAMARNHRAGILPGYGYSLSDRDFVRWDYLAYRYYHPKCGL